MGKLFPHGLTGIIFDCDGVLVDSEIIAAQVESNLLTEAVVWNLMPKQGSSGALGAP